MIDTAAAIPRIPSTHFVSTEFCLRDQFDAWRERISVIFNVDPLADSNIDGFPAEALAFHLGELLLVRTRFDAQRFTRTSKRIRSDMLDHYLVQYYSEGGYVGEVEGDEIEIRPGAVSVLDLARATQTRATEAQCVSLVIPRDVMNELLPSSINLHGVVLDAGNSRLFSTYLTSLLRQLPTAAMKQAPHIARATCNLLTACLLPSLERLDAIREPIKAARLLEERSGHHPSALCRDPSVAIRRKPATGGESVSLEDVQFDDWVRALRA